MRSGLTLKTYWRYKINTDLINKKIVFEDENSFSVKEETCQTCKHLFTGAFPSDDPCTDCIRCSLWESHIEEVKFETGKDVFESVFENNDGSFEYSGKDDAVNHPPHYTAHPSGVECIQITEHMGFNLGNAIKYIWRANLKAKLTEDIEKAIWYLNRELKRAKGETKNADDNTIQSCCSETSNDDNGC